MSRSRRIARFALRALLGLALVLVALLASAYAFTFTDRFRELARTQVLTLLHGSFRGEVAIERFEGSVWGDLVLRGVRLRFADVEVVAVPEVRLRYALLPLLRSRLEIVGIDLSSPAIDLRQDDAGAWNLTTALTAPTPAPASSGSALAISIAAIRAEHGRIAVTPCRGPSTCLLEDTSLDTSIDIDAKGIDANVRRLSLRGAVEGLPLTWLEASLHYRGAESPARVEVQNVSLATQRSRIVLHGTVEDFQDPRAAKTDALLTLDTVDPADVAIFAPQATLEAPIRGSLRLSGPANDLHAHLDAASGAARVGAELHADAAASPPAADGTIEVHDLDVGRTAGSFGVGGVVNARVRGAVRGTDLAAARGDADLEVRSASFQQWQLGDLQTRASVADARASVDGTLKGASGQATWKASADLGGAEKFAANVVVDHLDPKRFQSTAMRGDLNVRASVEGRGFALERQQSHAVVTLARSRLDRLVISKGGADLRIAGGRLRIGELSLEAEKATLRASGDVGLARDARGEAKLRAAIGDVAPWLALAGTEGRGALEADATVRGGLGDLAANGTVTATALGAGTASVDRGTVTFDLRGIGAKATNGRVDVAASGIRSAVSLTSATANATLSGASPKFVADLVLAARDLENHDDRATLRVTYEPDAITVDVSTLHLSSPQASFDLVHPSRVSYRGGALDVQDLRLAGGGASFVTSGRVSQTGPQRLELTAERLPLDWMRSFSPQAPETKGLLALRASVGGTAAAPSLDAAAEVSGLEVAGQPYAGLHATIAYRNPQATLDVRFDQDATHSLTATGRLPLEARWDPAVTARVAGNLDLSVHSNGLSLAFVNAVSPRTVHQVTGEILVDLESHGPVDSPSPHGRIALRDGGATIPPLGVAVGKATVEVNVAPDAIRIATLSATANDGRLDGGGTITLAGFAPDRLDLHLGLDRWPAIATSRYRSDLSGQVLVRGTAAAPEVGGKMEVLWGIFRPDLAFLGKEPKPRDPTIQVVAPASPEKTGVAPPPPPPATAPPAQPSSDAYKNLALDYTVVIHRNTWINNPSAAAELEGEVHAVKVRGQDLRLSGNVEIVRGWMVFQGRRFKVSHGVLSFTGGSEINPSLDVIADYKAGDYLVHVNVGGTANAPSLRLTSEPDLTQADILSVLVFGKPANELNQGQRTDMKQRATELATSFAVSEIGQSVSEALGLSGRGIQVEEISTERLAVGSYITDKTFVSIAENLSGNRGQEVAVEYEVIPNWGLQTSTTSTGSSGADVIWRKRY